MTENDQWKKSLEAKEREKLIEEVPIRQCPHGFHHPEWPHSCDGCFCEGERDRREYGWPHDTTPKKD